MEPKILVKIDYKKLKSRQKENYNFHKVAAILADYGFTSIRLTDDWQRADFIAYHIDGTSLFIQLKSRLIFAKKYQGKSIWICFPYKGRYVLYPHDEVMKLILEKTNISNTDSWQIKGVYSFPTVSRKILKILKPFFIG